MFSVPELGDYERNRAEEKEKEFEKKKDGGVADWFQKEFKVKRTQKFAGN